MCSIEDSECALSSPQRMLAIIIIVILIFSIYFAAFCIAYYYHPEKCTISQMCHLIFLLLLQIFVSQFSTIWENSIVNVSMMGHQKWYGSVQWPKVPEWKSMGTECCLTISWLCDHSNFTSFILGKKVQFFFYRDVWGVRMQHTHHRV